MISARAIPPSRPWPQWHRLTWRPLSDVASAWGAQSVGPLDESSGGDRHSPPHQPPPASDKPSYDTAYVPSYSDTECLLSLITAELSGLPSELFAEESAEFSSYTSPDLYAYMDTSSSVDVAFALSTLLTSDVPSAFRKHELQSGVIAVGDVVSTSVHHDGDASVYADVDTD
jgi:hypothetical protein